MRNERKKIDSKEAQTWLANQMMQFHRSLPRELQIMILKTYLNDSEVGGPQIFDPLIALFDVGGGECDTSVLLESIPESDVQRRDFVFRIVELGAVRLFRSIVMERAFASSLAKAKRPILLIALENCYHSGNYVMLVAAAKHFMRDGILYDVWDDVMEYPGILGLIDFRFDEGLALLVTLLRVPRFRRCLSRKMLDDALHGICRCRVPLNCLSERSRNPVFAKYPELLEECHRLLLAAGADTGVFFNKTMAAALHTLYSSK